MKLNKYIYAFIFYATFITVSYSQTVKILFDAKKAETAGNADWVIDADQWNLKWNPNATVSSSNNQANAQRFPTPSQTLITSSTPETFWTGGISAWGIDCVKKGYQVETLPYNGQITYGNTSNPQDLSNYKVYIVCEPNIIFTSTEKTAMINFVKNGGSLFMISGHAMSDHNFDGNDSPIIWNDFITNNGVLNSAMGFTFDLADISQISSTIPFLPTDSILNGPMGNVTQVKWSGGTTISLNPSQNSSVKGVIYKSGSGAGNYNVLCAYARLGKGKVAAISDSSPADDATGDPNDVLYDGYITDATGNHKRLLMNITIWLARTSANAANIPEQNLGIIKLFPNPTNNLLTVSIENNLDKKDAKIFDITGREINRIDLNETETTISLERLPQGIYFLKIYISEQLIFTHKVIKVD